MSVGLVGSGDWASRVHAPVFQDGSETRLVGVWNRGQRSAEELAARYGCRVFSDIDALVEASELVSYAVPPTAQATLARRAVLAGRPVLLEKPVAVSVDEAEDLAELLAARRVRSLLFLTYRYSPQVAAFTRECRRRGPVGAELGFATTTHPADVTGWRREHGLLLDLGFHVFDLLDAAVGAIRNVSAGGDRSQRVSVLVTHVNGCRSEADVSWAGLPTRRTELEVSTERGSLALGPDACRRGPWLASGVRAAVWSLVRGGECAAAGIERGLYLQRCVEAAHRSSAQGGEPVDIAECSRSSERSHIGA